MVVLPAGGSHGAREDGVAVPGAEALVGGEDDGCRVVVWCVNGDLGEGLIDCCEGREVGGLRGGVGVCGIGHRREGLAWTAEGLVFGGCGQKEVGLPSCDDNQAVPPLW